MLDAFNLPINNCEGVIQLIDLAGGSVASSADFWGVILNNINSETHMNATAFSPDCKTRCLNKPSSSLTTSFTNEFETWFFSPSTSIWSSVGNT